MKITFFEPYKDDPSVIRTSGPYGTLYLASYLEHNIDQKFEFAIEVDINLILKNKPDMVGISAYTETFVKAINAAEIIKKELNIPVIIGGNHITALPSNLKSCFDVGVVGFGEQTMGELVQTYLDKKGFYSEDLNKIQGIVFRDGDKLHITPERLPVRNLDILPPPKREILQTYWPGLKKVIRWDQAIYTSRGCPYKCPFCVNSKVPFVLKYHSPQRVISEIEEIVKKFPEQHNIPIFDELIILNKRRLREIADLIISEKLNRKVSFFCACSSNHFDEEVASILKEMNVNYIAFGFESGDEENLQYLKADSSTVEENVKAIDLCNKYGIYSTGFFIIGSPSETKKSLTTTYWFIRQNTPPLNIATPFWLTPYPGTKVWDYALEKGVVDPETEDWGKYNYYNSDEKFNIFLNEKSDFEFFRNAYNNEFMEMHKRERIMEEYHNPQPENNYYDKVFSQLNKYNLKYEDNILEVGTYFNKSIKYYFEEEKSITKFDHWIYLSEKQKIKEYEDSVISGQKFDLIVFNHSLEQIIKPYEKLEYFINNYLSDNGKLIILVKNPQFMKSFLEFLYGKWEGLISGYKKFDDYFQINIPELEQNLNKFGMTKVKLVPIKESLKVYEYTLHFFISMIPKNLLTNDLASNGGIRSFLFVCEK